MKHWLSPQDQYNYLSWIFMPAGYFGLCIVGIQYFTGVASLVWAGLAFLWFGLCTILAWHLKCPHCGTMLRWGPFGFLTRKRRYWVPAVCIRCKGRLDSRDYEGSTLEWTAAEPKRNDSNAQ